MAIIGNGAQSEFQAIAFKAVCGIDTLRLFDIDSGATEKLARNLEGTGLSVTRCTSVEDAVMGADILTTCTADKNHATILTDNHIGSGIHINAIGGDCPGKTEIHPDILLRSDIFVEYAPQTRIEGELQQLPQSHPVTEFSQVLSGTAPGRTSAGQVTLFDGVGFATEDFSALCFVRDLLEHSNRYTRLDMIADPDDPKDLYGMLMRASA